jgi:hypothetical protein
LVKNNSREKKTMSLWTMIRIVHIASGVFGPAVQWAAIPLSVAVVAMAASRLL